MFFMIILSSCQNSSVTTSDANINDSNELNEVDVPEVEIDGVGEFKIGMEENSFTDKYPKIEEENETIVNKLYFESSKFDDLYDAFLLTPDVYYSEGWGIINHGNNCSKAHVYKVKAHKVAGLELDLKFVFYNKKLIKISTDDTSIENAIETKYGEGAEIKEDAYCKSTTIKWKNKDINTTSEHMYCPYSGSKYEFSIEKEPEVSEYQECEEKDTEKAKEEVKAKRDEALDEL